MHGVDHRYNITVTVGRDASYRLDPARFTAAAERVAWSRSASIISSHLAGKIISIVTGNCAGPVRSGGVARAVVSDAFKHQALASSR